MIIDCFSFFEEYDLLEARLEYLNPVVDLFVITEGNYTFSGIPKNYNFLSVQERYKKYENKIIYIPVNMLSSPSKNTKEETIWERDFWQKDQAFRVLKLLPHNTTIMFGDLDEIPIREKIVDANNVINKGLLENKAYLITIGMEMFYYNFKQKHSTLWPGTVIFPNIPQLSSSLREVRKNSMGYNLWDFAGYHLSYWNTPENISKKIKSFAHSEFNSEEYWNTQNIKKSIEQGVDLFNRSWVPYTKVNTDSINKEFYDIFSKFEIKI